MQTMVSDKTFHLKWNNHLQNLSQLFTTIYSSSALADVTLSCRDGTIKAHKLVLSACSPYFEQIFKDNPCQHPIVILKGIPFSEINLLVEFMYKGSVDVQELDLQSLMHTASELEIRGLAYEARDNAAQMLNVNLEYPSYPSTTVNAIPQQQPQGFPQARTDVERLKQIHMYQQSMMRAEELRRRRRDEPSTHTAVNNILAAAAREMEEARNAGGRSAAGIQTEAREVTGTSVKTEMDDERPKKRMSILTSEEERLKAKKKPQMTVRFQDEVKMEERPNKITSPGAANESKCDENKSGGIKVVQLSALQKPQANDDDSDEREKSRREDDDEETDSSGSVSDSGANDSHEGRPHVCDICDVRFQRASHLSRHRLTHTGERPFTCGGCGRSFARSDKLRVHTKICERDDPTVDMSNDTAPTPKRETSSEVMSGMVRTTHRESGHLVFTASGDVMLPPRQPVLLNAQLEEREAAGGGNNGGGGGAAAAGDAPRRGRGRPRKTPLPLTPKIKKRRGRPPKTSLDGMEGCVLTSGSMLAVGGGGGGGGGALGSPAQHQLLLKRRRGRPPKNYMLGAGGEFQNLPFGLSVEVSKTYGRPNENYNATNLPFGDFSYLTDMMYIPTLQQFAYQQQQSQPTPAPPPADDSLLDNSEVSTPADSTHERTIDVSDSETDEDEHPNVEPEENVPPVAMETQIMTVGDCQIVKLPNMDDDKNEVVDNNVPASTGSVTITPIKTVGDCTIRPVENNT